LEGEKRAPFPKVDVVGKKKESAQKTARTNKRPLDAETPGEPQGPEGKEERGITPIKEAVVAESLGGGTPVLTETWIEMKLREKKGN